MLDTVFLNKLRRVFAMVVTLAVLVVAFFVPGLLAKALVAAVIGAFFWPDSRSYDSSHDGADGN